MSSRFTCRECGETFGVPQAALDKYAELIAPGPEGDQFLKMLIDLANQAGAGQK